MPTATSFTSTFEYANCDVVFNNERQYRTWDPSMFIVYHFVDYVPVEWETKHRIQSSSKPHADKVIGVALEYFKSNDVHRSEPRTPSGAKFEFQRGLCRLVSARFPVAAATCSPEEYLKLAQNSFRRGVRARPQGKVEELPFDMLCRLGLVATAKTPKKAAEEAQALVRFCTKTDAWVAARALMLASERFYQAGDHKQARALASQAIQSYSSLSSWGSLLQAQFLAGSSPPKSQVKIRRQK